MRKSDRTLKQATKRTGLHKCSCWSCGEGSAYVTVPQIERRHVPVCFCGGRLVPDRFDLAEIVLDATELRQHGEWAEYQNYLAGAVKGQTSHVQRGNVTRAPESIALEHVAKARKQAARMAQAAALQSLRPVEAMPF